MRPNIPQFCVTTDGSEFAIASPNMRDVLKIDEYRTRPRPDLLKNCQSLNTTFVPVSFWVQALRSGEITINVWDVPEYVEPEAPSRFPADMDLSRWDGFIEACIPDLVNRYARIRENATVECTCFVTAVQLSVSPENLSYQYPKPLNIPFENLTEQERLAYSDLNFNCTDRTGNTDKDFDRLIAKLVAARSSETSVPQEELIVGQYSGISGYVNTNGPLEVLAIDRSSRAKNLKVGHFILQVEWQEVRNLKQLQEQIEAALARGKTSIRLSMQGDGGYYAQILEF